MVCSETIKTAKPSHYKDLHTAILSEHDNKTHSPTAIVIDPYKSQFDLTKPIHKLQFYKFPLMLNYYWRMLEQTPSGID